MRTKVIFMLVAVFMCALPLCADWGQAESPDFTLDTTVPEPALIMAAALPLWLLLRWQ